MGTGEPPQAISDGWLCERLGCWLEAGGLLDQPYRRTREMAAAMNVYQAFNNFTNRGEVSEGEWAKSNPRAYEIVQEMKESLDDE